MNFKRRFTDSTSGDLDKMIADEDDADMRTLLLMVSNINSNVQATARDLKELTTKVESYIEQFTIHAQEDAALLNKGKGMLMLKQVVIGLFGFIFVVAQGVVGYAWTNVSKDSADIHNAINSIQISVAHSSSDIESLETRLDEHIGSKK